MKEIFIKYNLPDPYDLLRDPQRNSIGGELWTSMVTVIEKAVSKKRLCYIQVIDSWTSADLHVARDTFFSGHWAISEKFHVSLQNLSF